MPPTPAPAPIMSGARTFTVLGLLLSVALLRLLSRYLPADLAKQLADALSADVVAAVAAGGALLGVWFRSRVNKPALPAVVKALPVLLLLGGCGSAWPQQCEQTLAGIECKCTKSRVEKGPAQGGALYPAARITVDCDGKLLPLTIDADEVR